MNYLENNLSGVVIASYRVYPAVMAQWLGYRTRNHKVTSLSPVTAVSSLGIGSLNHNSVPDMTG